MLLRSILLSLLATIAVASPAPAHVPRGFVGADIGGAFFYPGMDQNAEMGSIAASGVNSVRVVFSWSLVQPYSSFASVPASQRAQFRDVGGVPTNFSSTDQVVALAAAHHLTILPVLEYAPSWAARKPGNPASPPSSPAAYARFAVAMVDRYGPHGSFWSENPTVPRVAIRMWQVWNEPNFTSYWLQQPFEASYVQLLRAAHDAIKGADPGAEVVMAGLTNFSWKYLARIYRIRGARGAFDAVAAHPYTATAQGVITILGKVRAVMNRSGDRRKPILASEISWPSAKGKAPTRFENATTEAGQAKALSQVIPLLARNRKRLRLQSFYYYTWITNETMPGAGSDPFNFAGLWKFVQGAGVSPKPAYAAFVRAVKAIER
jgi:hypothetical protein